MLDVLNVAQTITAIIGGLFTILLAAGGLSFAIWKGALKLAVTGNRIESRIGSMEESLNDHIDSTDRRFQIIEDTLLEHKDIIKINLREK